LRSSGLMVLEMSARVGYWISINGDGNSELVSQAVSFWFILFPYFLLCLICFLRYIMLLLPLKKCFRSWFDYLFRFWIPIFDLIRFCNCSPFPIASFLFVHDELNWVLLSDGSCWLYCAFRFGTLLQNIPFPVYVVILFYGDTFGTSINGGRFET